MHFSFGTLSLLVVLVRAMVLVSPRPSSSPDISLMSVSSVYSTLWHFVSVVHLLYVEGGEGGSEEREGR